MMSPAQNTNSAEEASPEPRPELTNAEKLERIHWNTALSGINTVFAQLTYFGSAFPLFLAELNFTNTEIGILFSFIPFAALVALFIAPVVARWGHKRTFVTFFGFRKIATAFLLLVPWVQDQYGTQAVLIYVTVVILGFSLVRAIAETGYYPWAHEFIPNSIRGKYTAINDIVSRLTSVAAILLAGYLLALPLGLNRYMLLFAIALVFGGGAVWAASHIPGGAPRKESDGEKVSYRSLLTVLRDGNFALYLVGFGLVSLAAGPIGSFLPLFMKREVGLNESEVVLLQLGAMIGGLAATYLLGWAADRYGSKPVMLLGIAIKAVLPLTWLFMPRFSSLSLPIAMVISVFNGIADIAFVIGSARLLYVGLVPAEKKTQYMALYYAAAGLVGGVSQVLGGYVLDAAAGLSGQFLFLTLDPFTPLFIGVILLTLAGLFLLRPVRADSRFSFGEVAGLFTHGNPILALEYMVRYYRSRDERSTIVMTERMGQTKSPLTVDELLEALRDPRFNVRFEAMIAVARMDPDSRLIEALSRVLAGTELSLSTIAAWALGRMGDARALPALREGLNSDYRSIRAHCARALGAMHDSTIVPLLLQRLTTEDDNGLRIAYACVLGQLGSPVAIETLFEILNATDNEGARMELALSIARLAGDEQPFIRLWRQASLDPGTAVSQAISSFRKKLNNSFPGDLITAADNCAGAFARDDFATGSALLSQLLSQLPADSLPEVEASIIAHCAQELEDFGPGPLEYIMLATHLLQIVLPHLTKTQPS